MPSVVITFTWWRRAVWWAFWRRCRQHGRRNDESDTIICKCYPNCPELVIQNHKGCRPQDIRTTITSFVEIGERKEKVTLFLGTKYLESSDKWLLRDTLSNEPKGCYTY